MRVDRLVAGLGYGSRRDIHRFIEDGRLTRRDGTPLGRDDRVPHAELRFDGEPLDPPPPLTVLLNKPTGFTCSTDDEGPLVYDLLPPRFARRHPPLAVAGRLDKDTTGLVVLTDDGPLLHRIISPKKGIWKTYIAVLADPLRSDEAGPIEAGTIVLRNESKPCAPARFAGLDAKRVRIGLSEGRYHQVRRMFAALGHRVDALHRESIGRLRIGDLAEGAWRPATAADLEDLFAGDPADR